MALFTKGKYTKCDEMSPPRPQETAPDLYKVEDRSDREASTDRQLQELQKADEEAERVKAAEEVARVKAAEEEVAEEAARAKTTEEVARAEAARVKYYQQSTTLGAMDLNIHMAASAQHPNNTDDHNPSTPGSKLRAIEREVETLEVENRELQSKLSGTEDITDTQPCASSGGMIQAPAAKRVESGSKVLRAFKRSSELLSKELASHRNSVLGIVTRYNDSANETWKVS